MCNINLIMRKNKQTDRKITQVINVMSHDGYYINDDGQGFVTLKQDTKKGITYAISKSITEHLCEDYGFLIMSHERASTSGLQNPENNLQPIETNDFIILHNGILYDYGDTHLSDTHHLILELQKRYIENPKINIKTLIRDIAQQISGSFSILLYFKPEQKLFYFKESSTSFWKAQDRDYLILSTSQDNVKYAVSVLKINSEVKEVKNEVIYSVLDNFQSVTTFKEQSNFYTKYMGNSYGHSCYDKPMFKPASEEEADEGFVNDHKYREFCIEDFMEYYYGGRLINYSSQENTITCMIPNGHVSDFNKYFTWHFKRNEGEKFTTIVVDTEEFLSFMDYYGYDWGTAVHQYRTNKNLDLIEKA